MEDYLGDFFTVTIPDATSLHCWRLINVVPRLKEIATYLEQMLHPLASVISGWDTLTPEEIDTVVNYIFNGDITGLIAWLKIKFPTAPPNQIEGACQNFLYGYYNLSISFANTLAIEIVAEEYSTLPEGMKIQYKASRDAKTSTIYELGDTYLLSSWEHRIFSDGALSFEVWGEFWYTSVWEDVVTWDYARQVAEAFKASKYGATIQARYNYYPFEDNATFYTVSYEDTFWATIGSRRETFLPEPIHYYDHYVNPALLMTTDPTTRGGIYSAYFTPEWQYHTDHPETMGNPWAGDEEERPYDDDLYNWINITVNPPGFTDQEHQFLLTMQCDWTIHGYGRDPRAIPPVFGGRPGLLSGGILSLASLSPLSQVSIYRPCRRF